MNRLILLYALFFIVETGGLSQTKKELEVIRDKTLGEINYVDKMLKSTIEQRVENINDLKIINNKLNLRDAVIRAMREEINLLSERIDLNILAIDMMEEDLVRLKKDYAKTILNSYRYRKIYPDIVYILSAKDFNQGYKRLKYLQQVTKYRRNESELILELKSEIELSKRKLQNDLMKISDLTAKEVVQKRLIVKEQSTKEELIRNLNSKEKQLRKELEEKRKVARKIESEIAKIIEEERKKGKISVYAPEEKLVGDNFYENKGKLPWPVDNGIITSHFGVQKHPVLKYLTENNIGIEITSYGKVSARSIFQGEVSRVFTIQGENMTVIIRHGKYLTVYLNIVNVRVKQGDKVGTKQEIGDVYSDPKNNNNCILKFMIFENEAKYLDPEGWITKN
jgi:murein hydrolase activator